VAEISGERAASAADWATWNERNGEATDAPEPNGPGYCGYRECPGSHYFLVQGCTGIAWCLPLARRLILAEEAQRPHCRLCGEMLKEVHAYPGTMWVALDDDPCCPQGTIGHEERSEPDWRVIAGPEGRST
jgi:aminoglycoside phosphotransferase (APT) family kinase protein